MLTFKFTGVSGEMTVSDVLTSGMVGREVQINLSDDWDGLYKTAVFSAGEITRAVPLEGDTVTIPWEVLVSPFKKLMVGVCGTDENGTLVIPTILAEGPVIRMGADPHAMEGTEPEIPLGALTLTDAEVKTDGPDIALQTAVGAEIGRVLVNAGTVVTLRTPGENFGDASAEDVLEGVTFTSAAGLMVEGTRKKLRTVNGITSMTVINTELEAVSGLVLYRDTVNPAGLVCAVYNGDTVWCVCSAGDNICAVGSGAYGTANRGTFTWGGVGIADFAEGAAYHFIAWYEG